MKKILIILFAAFFVFSACSSGNRDGDRELIADPVEDPKKPTDPNNPGDIETPKEPVVLSGIFSNTLGSIIPLSEVSKMPADETGKRLSDDYDGDGIPNADEITTNPFIAEYPKVVTRISTPITMEIRISASSVSENHVETIEDSGVSSTLTNSMEDRQYSQMNKKTTPYVVKDSISDSESNSESWGESSSVTKSSGGGINLGGYGGNYESSSTKTDSYNESFAKSFAKSSSSEKTVFEDVDYADNLDRSGVAFTDETVEKVTRNARKSDILKNTDSIGPNSGIVRASLFLKNESVNFPARIKNVKCTLTFKTPSGKFLPIKTFILRNDDYSLFEQDIYGNEELGPYAIEVSGLNTKEVTNALKNGYIPQICVVSYDIVRVADSNYNPGVDNLKIVEENAKGRTAFIKVSAEGMRENFRVCAFDVDSSGNITPGISLKKALFNIFKSRVGRGEDWLLDNNRQGLTVLDNNLKWKASSPNASIHTLSSNTTGNNWREFETYIKSYQDEYGQTKYIETIKRIGEVTKYNPFDKKDNPSYDPNDLLSESEIKKTKYWYILHNGKYFEGDINDPIWAGDRYEIVCFDANDFTSHFASYNFTPIQSQEKMFFDTRWNSRTNSEDFSRAVYFGKVYRDDKVMIEIDLAESRFLFNNLSNRILSDLGTEWKTGDISALYRTELSVSSSEYVSGYPSEFRFNAYGGVNSINVNINESENASEYEISVKNDSGSVRTYIVDSALLKSNGYTFSINSRTKDTSGSETGFIRSGTYIINVKALGNLYGVSVSKPSYDKNASITVMNYAADSIPGNFSFSVFGGSENFSVSLSGGKNTEYYAVHLTGPLNPGVTPERKTYYASAGNNVFSVNSYPSDFQRLVDTFVPGVYKVEVYPVNKAYENESQYSNIPAYMSREQYVTIAFEKFTSQKSLRAKRVTSLSDFNAINLEANFNDGTGWHSLRVLGDVVDHTREIDCRSKKYYDQANQKFCLTFDPPKKTGFSLFDIFTGGRDCVDLYLRAVPKSEYRDRFWPKPTSNVTITADAEKSFSDLWVNSADDKTDATKFEDILLNNGVSGSYTLSSSNKTDYFFSPYEYRLYGVTVKLDDSMYNLADSSYVDDPTFESDVLENGVTAEKAFFVRSITSNYCSKYYVYYKDCGLANLNDEALMSLKSNVAAENVEMWSKAGGADGFLAGSDFTQVLKIGYDNSYGILPNHYYAVAVVGVNADGKKSGAVKYKNESDMGALSFLIPRSIMKPEIPYNFMLSLKDSGKDVTVSNFNSLNATEYEVQYIPRSFLPQVINTNVNLDSYAWIPKTINTDYYNVIGLDYWKNYAFRVRAVNTYAADVDRHSDWSDIKEIYTAFEGYPDNDDIKVRWVERDVDEARYRLEINIPASSLPQSGVKSVEIYSSMTFPGQLDNFKQIMTTKTIDPYDGKDILFKNPSYISAQFNSYHLIIELIFTSHSGEIRRQFYGIDLPDPGD
ncbi:MAG TPA: hypothetical protein PK624_01875 [Spirochaetota bacterium]|nr:hypothetical protein [Spirochaetota bacterium]HOR43524.1 hypothetical protein [Spirochaetota bacterium]